MGCERYYELLSARLDGELTPNEAHELEDHVAQCPGCAALAEQLEGLHEGFSALEEIPAPDGFTHRVMEQIGKEEKKVLPLIRRPQIRALVGVAACLAICFGVYRVGQNSGAPQVATTTLEQFDQAALSSQVQEGERPLAPDKYSRGTQGETLKDSIQTASSPQGEHDLIQAQVQPDAKSQKNAQTVILTLDRMPQGGEELLPPSTACNLFVEEGAEHYVQLTAQQLDQLEELACTQNIPSSRSTEYSEEGNCVLVILQP